MTEDVLNGIVGVHPTVNMLAVVEVSFDGPTEQKSIPTFFVAGGPTTLRSILRDLASEGIRMGIVVEVGPLSAGATEEPYEKGDRVFYQDTQAIKIGDRTIMGLSAVLAYKKENED